MHVNMIISQPALKIIKYNVNCGVLIEITQSLANKDAVKIVIKLIAVY